MMIIAGVEKGMSESGLRQCPWLPMVRALGWLQRREVRSLGNLE